MDDIIEKASRLIPQIDFGCFVKPYDSEKILVDLRNELGKAGKKISRL